MDLTKYSAKTLKNIINTYKPSIEIRHDKETVRKYLIHIIKTDKDLKNISNEIYESFEIKSKEEYDNDLLNIKNEMIQFIKNKQKITVYEYVLQPRWPNDPTYHDTYNEIIKSIDFIDSDYNIIINKRKFIIKPWDKKWCCGSDYILFT